MGGHGGLNILPQKRWHLYRDDNRARVARDEAEDQKRREEAEHQRRTLDLDAKIGRLRARAVEAGLVEKQPSLDGENSKVDPLGCDYTTLPVVENVVGLQKESTTHGFYDNGNHKRQSNHHLDEPSHRRRRKTEEDGLRRPSSPKRHFNLFCEEETEYKKVEAAHKKYLSEVGHDSTDISDFDRIISQTSTPWYLQPKNKNELKNEYEPQKSKHTEPSIIKRMTASTHGGFRSESKRRHQDYDVGRRFSSFQGVHGAAESRERFVSSSTSTSIASSDSDDRHKTKKDRRHHDEHLRKHRKIKKTESKHDRKARKRLERDMHMTKLRAERIAREAFVMQ